MIAGYLFGAFAIPRIVSQEKAFLISGLLGLAITFLAITIPGMASIAFVALLGVANAMLWPAIWPQALKGLQGEALNKASAVLIMGIAGGAVLPMLYGWMAHHMNHQRAYWILVPCYLFNIYYWTRGRDNTVVALQTANIKNHTHGTDS
jgi:fucose permease